MFGLCLLPFLCLGGPSPAPYYPQPGVYPAPGYPSPYDYPPGYGYPAPVVPDGAGGYVPYTNSRVLPDGSLRPYTPEVDGPFDTPGYAPPPPY
jgi:hypothetical protein